MGQVAPREPVEVYSLQIFRVVSHHPHYVRAQLANNQYASIDITELTDKWLPGVIDQFPVGHWGTARLISNEDGYQASCRTPFLKPSLWEKCMHPIKSSSLSFQKEIKPTPFDLRSILYKNPGHPVEVGTTILGYVTGVTDHGLFIKFGFRKDQVVMVPLQEVSDDQNTAVPRHVPVLVLITRVHEGKLRGSMRFSLISRKVCAQPSVGEVVEGIVTEVKN